MLFRSHDVPDLVVGFGLCNLVGGTGDLGLEVGVVDGAVESVEDARDADFSDDDAVAVVGVRGLDDGPAFTEVAGADEVFEVSADAGSDVPAIGFFDDGEPAEFGCDPRGSPTDELADEGKAVGLVEPGDHLGEAVEAIRDGDGVRVASPPAVDGDNRVCWVETGRGGVFFDPDLGHEPALGHHQSGAVLGSHAGVEE